MAAIGLQVVKKRALGPQVSEGSSTPVLAWREREGVEPTAPTAGPGPTDLKSAKPTRAHPLPGRVGVSRRLLG